MADSDLSKLLVFGDSLSDAGMAYALSGAVLKVSIPPNSAGYNGWFSNGRIQSLVTADLLGIPADVYAVGGARAVGSRTVAQYLEQSNYDTPEIILPNPDPEALATDTYLDGQVGQYLADVAADPPGEGTAASIWIGANDYNGLVNPSPVEVALKIAEVVGSTIEAAAAIAETGVERILLYNLPAPDFLPVPTPPGFGELVDAHNAALAAEAGLLRAQGIDAEIVDLHRMGEEITSDPRTFGLNPAYLDQPLLLGIGSQPTWIPEEQNWYIPPNLAVAGVDPDQIMFADYLHPSSATHGILGSFVAASISDHLVFLGSGNDVRFTGARDDLVLGGAGNDAIFSQRGDDTVFAGLGNDLVFAGRGRDIVAGGAGNDHVHGGSGSDVVAGSDGDDVQAGGRGNDLMVDGLGFDRIWGGWGDDAFLYTEAAFLGGLNAEDGGIFRGGRGMDTLYLCLGDDTRAAVEAELSDGSSSQSLPTIDVTTRSIEHYVFLDPGQPISEQISTGSRDQEADLWGII